MFVRANQRIFGGSIQDLAPMMTNVTLSRVGVIVPARLKPDAQRIHLPEALEFFESIDAWAAGDRTESRLIVFDPTGHFPFSDLTGVFRLYRTWPAIVAVLSEVKPTRLQDLLSLGTVAPVIWNNGQSFLSVLTTAVATVHSRRVTRLNAALSRFHSLDTLERRVLNLLMAGLRNKAISARLELGPRTVDARKRRILTKFETDSMSQVIRQVAWIEIAVSWDLWESDRKAG